MLKWAETYSVAKSITETNFVKTSDPFQPLVTDKIQARGVFDCKGLFVAHLEAIQVTRSNCWNVPSYPKVYPNYHFETK